MQRGVLFISPRGEDAAALTRILKPAGVPLVHARDLRQARSRLEAGSFGVVLTEAVLPDGSWTDVLDWKRRLGSLWEVLVTHAFADSRLWAEVLSLGAYDLVVQPFFPSEVQRIIANASSRPARARALSAVA